MRTDPKTNQKKNAQVHTIEWTGLWRQFLGGCELLLMRLLTHTSRIPPSWGRASRTVPALQDWETSKTTLKNYRQQNDEEEQHNLDGLELSTENNLTLLEHSPGRVGTSDPKRVPLGWPAALGHLSLCSSAVVLQLPLLHLTTVACSL